MLPKVKCIIVSYTRNIGQRYKQCTIKRNKTNKLRESKLREKRCTEIIISEKVFIDAFGM